MGKRMRSVLKQLFFVLGALVLFPSLMDSVRAQEAVGGLVPTSLSCEYLANPWGLDVAKPRLSWQVAPVSSPAAARGLKVGAYQILVAGSAESLKADKGDLWDSGKIVGDKTIQIPYAGAALGSFQKCFWKVRVWDQADKASAWSEPAFWTMGVLKPEDWTAKWITLTRPAEREVPEFDAKAPRSMEWRQKAASPIFRKEFKVEKKIKSATAYICGLGYYELRLNGKKVGDHELDPAFTRFDQRSLYVTYDVTAALQPGDNAVGVMLGNGFYNSHTRDAWDFDKAPWRDEPKLLAQIRLEYEDGSVETVATDPSWKANTGPVVLDGTRQGEFYDARKEMPGWDKGKFDDSAWKPAELAKPIPGLVSAQMMPPIRQIETLKPVKITEPKPGIFVFDMGQNMTGWAQLKVQGPAGTKVEMRYGERLKTDGTLDQLGEFKVNAGIAQHVFQGPFQTDTYILKGQGEEVWHPHFDYHGFQYVEVTGFPGKPEADNITACVLHTDFKPAGSFACSNELLNKIQTLTSWSYRGNYFGYPTDCPHREKNGWTGDAHLAAEYGMLFFHNQAGYTKWMNDFFDEQRDSGELPGIVPTGGWGYAWGNGPAWDSAYILIPWYLYLYNGDTGILATHYDRMKRYVDYLQTKAKDEIVSIGLGDWVPAKTETPVPVTSTGYYYADTVIVSKAAKILGREADAKVYADRAEQIRQGYNKAFYKGDGVYANGSQTALSCALYQGLADPAEMKKVTEKLVAAVHGNGDKIDVGILGAKYLFRALTANGQNDVAYAVAIQKAAPSYGAWVEQGATTLWEEWAGTGSRNHIMFGDISAWMVEALAGLAVDPEQPGFKHTIVRPHLAPGLTWAKAEHQSPYGRVADKWELKNGVLTLSVSIPPNATAQVHVPAASEEGVTESGKPASQAAGVRFVKMADGAAVFEVESGEYVFSAKQK